jgi:hypothetical protein
MTKECQSNSGTLPICNQSPDEEAMQGGGKRTNTGGRNKRNKKAKPTLTPPYRWRCRVCSEEGVSEALNRHCGKIVRQLAPVSQENSEWFSNFLNNKKWKFISPMNIEKLHCSVRTSEMFSIAESAGKELVEYLNNTTFETPEYFELYNPVSDHLRVSDLKKPMKNSKKSRGPTFSSAINGAIKWHGKTPQPQQELPRGPVEMGHIFDEFLTKAMEDIDSDDWAPGSKIKFFCEELNLTVGGSPDLMYDGIPVETKTTSKLPKRISKKKKKPDWYKLFRKKWNKNYLPQIAMYSQACQCEHMFLLLIARTTAEFTIVPVNAQEKYLHLRQAWNQWNDDSKLLEKIATYRELTSNISLPLLP